MAGPPGATVVVGTAGHIDHGKTTLLRALTGIDADRLPEERERGMTIDVGFAHLDLEDGTAIDFVDVPGHDRLVGNMLVGAGEIDAVLLVVAADDGPRAQTLEHLELLDALGLTRAVAAITKTDAVDFDRLAVTTAEVRRLVDATSMTGAAIVAVSSQTGAGLPELRRELVALRDAAAGDLAGRPIGPIRLPIDRAFTVKGRGLVVTGTLRGGSVTAGMTLRVVPGGAQARVREVQVHRGRAARAAGGRTALNLATVELQVVRRGLVLSSGPGVTSSDRLLVALRPPVLVQATRAGFTAPSWPPRVSAALRLHLWTATVDASVRPAGSRFVPLGDGSVAALVSLAEPMAVLAGARGVLRDPGSSRTIAGVTVLDPDPPRGTSRRRMTAQRLGALSLAEAAASSAGVDAGERLVAALVDLHGLLPAARRADAMAAIGSGTPEATGRRAPGASLAAGANPVSGPSLAADVEASLVADALDLARAGASIAEVRAALLRRLRRLASVGRNADGAAVDVIDGLLQRQVVAGRLRRDGERLGMVASGATESDVAEARTDAAAAALARLEAALDADVPPPLAEASRAAGCGPAGVVALERAGRIVRVEDDLAWATPRYLRLRDRAVAMARREPLAPAAFRDAIGANRRVVMPLLEDLDRKGFLRRTPAGHVPGPRA